MKRYFYRGNKLTKAWLDSQYNMIRMEDDIFRNALLAALKLDPQKVKTFNSLRETMLNMSMQQQSQYANNYHLQSLFNHFESLHRNSRGRSMIVRGKQSLSKDIVDPDKFPIWDLKKKPNIFYSIWSTIMGKIRYNIGHELIVKNSLIEHPEGGRGVFVVLTTQKNQIEIGQFLGLIPGIIYDSQESYQKIKLDSIKSYQKIPQHLHFPSGKVLELCEISHYDQITKQNVSLESYLINPYSLGQFINHPPYGHKPNVIFTQIECKQNFFPLYLQKYLPYNSFLPYETKQKNKKMRVFAIFAKQPIKHNEQLYVDYCESHIYPIDNIPQWMIQPDYKAQMQEIQPNQYNLNFSKEQYEHPSPHYWKLVENQALEENKKLYEKYLNIVKYRPNKVIFEDDNMKVSTMELNSKEKKKNSIGQT